MTCRCRVRNSTANPTPATPIGAARILTVTKVEEAMLKKPRPFRIH
jgi:hypothetical protein